MSIEAMKQALEALEWNLPVIEDYGDKEQLNRQHRAITALRTAIEQVRSAPEQKYLGLKPCWYESKEEKMCPKCGQVHAGAIFSAAQRQWIGLTDEEVLHLWAGDTPRPVLGKNKVLAFARAIEAKLKEKNT